MTKFKKLLLISTLALCLIATLALTACELLGGHTCTFGDWQTDTEATCTEDGLMFRSCTVCGERETQKIPAQGHTEGEWIIDSWATCTEDGSKHTECTVCGTTIHTDTISATHSYGEWIPQEDSDCVNVGMLGHYQCDACGKDFDENKNELTSLEISTKQHTEGDWIVDEPATCVQTGSKHTECKVCYQTVSTEDIPVNDNHVYGEWIKEIDSDCTNDGTLGHYHCDACGKDLDENIKVLTSLVISAKGHAEGDWIIDKAATCTQTGSKHTECTVCGETVTTETIPVNDDHVYGEWIPKTDSDCIHIGTLGHYHCNVCDKNFDADKKVLTSLTISVKGHNYVDGVCTVCHQKERSEGIACKLSNDGTYYIVTGIGTCTDTDVVIPFEHNGLPVKAIEALAFKDCTEITSVVIPDSITSIGVAAFRGCTGLTTVIIPENSTLAAIDGSAFCECSALISITIPDSVTTIDGSAFYDCSSLVSITIPAGVTTIGSEAFYNCTALTEINYNATNCADFEYKNDVFTYAGKNGDGIKVTISKNVQKIPDYLFFPNDSTIYVPNITELVFEEGSVCQSIGSYAFSGCKKLTDVTIVSSVTSIGNSAFSGWSALTEIHYNATNCADLSFNNYVFNHVGKDGDGIKVTIGKNVQKIPAYLFCPYEASAYLYVPNVTEVVFEEGSVCQSIGKYAFYHCPSLTSITIGESVTSIGKHAFSTCAALTEIHYNATNCDDLSDCNYVFNISGTGTEYVKVTIGKNVQRIPAYLFCPDSSSISHASRIREVVFEEDSVCQSIGEYAFCNCTNLRNVTIPESVTSIGEYAFYNCITLENVNYNATNCDDFSSDNYVFAYAGQNGSGIKLTVGKNVQKMPAYLFYTNASNRYAPKLTELVFEESSVCQSIGAYAFSCASLTSVTIPYGVTSIGNDAFSFCAELTDVTIPNTVTSIGNFAFCMCTSLTEITIPDSVTSIEFSAFNSCASLASVTIGKGVTSIGNNAFAFCPLLTEIYYNATNCDDLISSNTPFSYTGQDCEGIKVTIGKNVQKIPANLFNIGQYNGGSKITEVVFEEGSVCQSIGDSAFRDSTSLTAINYAGTEEEWNAIVKGSDWDAGAGKYTVNYNYREE